MRPFSGLVFRPLTVLAGVEAANDRRLGVAARDLELRALALSGRVGGDVSVKGRGHAPRLGNVEGQKVEADLTDAVTGTAHLQRGKRGMDDSNGELRLFALTVKLETNRR